MNKSSSTSVARMVMTAASLGIAGAIAPHLHDAANAQPTGLTGSYIGVTVDANKAPGLGQDWLQYSNSPTRWFINQALENTQQSPANSKKSNPVDASAVDSRGLQGRIDLQNSPISIRGKVSVAPNVSVVQPIVSYDLPIARNANLYAGAGYTFVTAKNGKQPQGTQNSVVLTAGAEAAVSDKIVVYGDAQYRVNQANIKTNNPVKIQVGVGYRF